MLTRSNQNTHIPSSDCVPTYITNYRTHFQLNLIELNQTITPDSGQVIYCWVVYQHYKFTTIGIIVYLPN